MNFLDCTLDTPADNLALDEALLLEAESGHAEASPFEVLRLWEPPGYFVVLGSTCKLRDDVDEDACRRDGVPILRRSSGGGTVLLGPGCLAYSLVLSFTRKDLRQVTKSYEYILGKTAAALQAFVPGVGLAGKSDLVLGDRKFSGNSQYRKRDYLLHHGTIMFDFDLDRIGRCLHVPKRQPGYRENRAHSDFLTNLPVEPDRLRSALRTGWDANRGRVDLPELMVRQLVKRRYSNPVWIGRF